MVDWKQKMMELREIVSGWQIVAEKAAHAYDTGENEDVTVGNVNAAIYRAEEASFKKVAQEIDGMFRVAGILR